MAERIVPLKALTKRQLLEKYRELDYVDEVQDLKCTRCNRLALEHWYTNCGHALCPNCKRLLSGGRCRCPHCGQIIQHIKELSADFEEKVNGLQAKCPNSKYGCPLVTTVKQLQEHFIGCEWTKNQALPALYTGTNTGDMLLEEVSKLKMQIDDMHETSDFLLKELHRQQEVEDDIKKSVEISVEEIKSRLNGLSSDLHFETTTLKDKMANINIEQLRNQFSSKREVKQQEQQLTKLDAKIDVMFKILDDKLDKFSQRLTKEIENITSKIKAGEDKVEVLRNEDKIIMNNFQHKQEVVVEKYRKEFLDNSNELQKKVEKSKDDFKMELHKLSSELTLKLEKQKTSFEQKLTLEVKQSEAKFDEKFKENGVKMEALINDLKEQEVVLMEKIHDKTKDFVSKEKLKQLQESMTEMNGSNKSLIQMLDQKEDRFIQKLTKEVEAIDAKIATSENKMEAALIRNIRDLQGKVEIPSKELEAQLQKLSLDLNQRLEQKEASFNQKLSNEVKQLDEKINTNKRAVEMNEKKTDEKMEAMKTETKKQEVDLNRQIVINVKEKFQGSIEELKKQLVKVQSDVTQGLNQEQLRCNQKFTEEIKILEEKMRKKEEEIEKKMNIRFEKQEVAVENCRKEMATISDVQRQVKGSLEKSMEQFDDQFKQILEEKMRKKEEEIEINIRFEKQEVAVENFRKEMAIIREVERQVKGNLEKSTEQLPSQFCDEITKMLHDVENKTEKLKEEIDQLNNKTSEDEKHMIDTFNCLLVDYCCKVETIQQLNHHLKPIETIERVIAIEQLVNRKSSVQQLVDSLLFGSAEEQMVIESLCLKWTIEPKYILPTVASHEYLSDVFPFYRFQIKAQLKFIITSEGTVELQLCFKDKERKGQKVDVKSLPMVTFIIKDLSGHSKYLVRNQYYLFNESLQYNEFSNQSWSISKSQWTALISPLDASLEVLVLVEPLTYIDKPMSFNGTMMDIIPQYSRKLQMEKEGLIEGHLSPSFLTHAGGFRVSVGMSLNEPIGIDEKGLGTVICFLPGEFDSQLGDEFEHETSVTLINQLDATKNITVKQQAKEAQSYRMAIASEDKIGSEGFLVNDSLTYQVTITPIKNE